ncbi:DUF4389 domain-containing protein [Actinoplanes sp. TBRC 11911]|uniref:DUF4389 domain-containing protein n=1 Tax=Actinoplanes sp. TBRC 11911 TaxID=2729386 RepID=UPI00145D242D|nr:DUF4389 domain-containing protein [Actinoplanes sp. TBRC 11911]NMO57258.1 DUF4389 domain-containing protein [Actinoplanes sp. TBRC 11911]
MNRYPVRVEAHPDPRLSRWLWLVKWLLLIPHYIVLLVLWTGLVVLTLVAYLAVLVTGRYPEPVRAYNMGVLRWTWRVGYYGYQALGTDTYPPFTLADVPDYPARLRLESHEQPKRWLPLVAWLFAFPHLVILGALAGAATRRDGAPVSVIAAVLLVAALALLFTGHYPRGLHDLLVGMARWGLRVMAYLILLTPYPPFRLDQGEAEPEPSPDPPDRAPSPAASAGGYVFALVAGVLLLAPAAGLGVGDGVLLGLDAARDRAGYVTSPTLALSTSTAAITAENLTITDTDLWTRDVADVGGLRVTARSANGQDIFVGIASQSAVDGWLAGTAHDEMTGLVSGTARYERAPGVTRAVSDPATQSFWVATASGSDEVTMRWDVTDGRYAVVVANADGSPGVVANVHGAIQVPDLTAIGAGLLAAGIMIGLLSVGLIVLGGVGLGRRHTPPPPPVGGPGGRVPEQLPPVPASN